MSSFCLKSFSSFFQIFCHSSRLKSVFSAGFSPFALFSVALPTSPAGASVTGFFFFVAGLALVVTDAETAAALALVAGADTLVTEAESVKEASCLSSSSTSAFASERSLLAA